MKQKYHTLKELIDMIDEPNRGACYRTWVENESEFAVARGASHNHQAWSGGYIDHLTETMNIATIVYPTLNKLRPLPFALSDALLVLYLHDLEKPWKYFPQENGGFERNDDLQHYDQIKAFVYDKIATYHFTLEVHHWNALEHIEKENNYDSQKRRQKPFAAFTHLCDTWSARGWYDHPLKENDPWSGHSK